MAVAQVQSTPWLGAAAQAAQRAAADVDVALTRHVTKMRVVADKVAQASQRHDAADTEAGQLVAKVGGQLQL